MGVGRVLMSRCSSRRLFVGGGGQLIINSKNFGASAVGFQNRIFYSSGASDVQNPPPNSQIFYSSEAAASNSGTGTGTGYSSTTSADAKKYLESSPRYVYGLHNYCAWDFPRYVKEKRCKNIMVTEDEIMQKVAEFAVLEYNQDYDDNLELVRVVEVKWRGGGPVAFPIILEAKPKTYEEEPPCPPMLFRVVVSLRSWCNQVELLAWECLEQP